jgi:HEAT repeat protein
MAISLQQLLARLDVDEPDYPALASLGPDVVPHLATLVRQEDPGLAAKAAYLASLIASDDAPDVVSAAAASSNESVRVAAASGLRNLVSTQAAATAERLLDDSDAGVRKQALHAVASLGIAGLGAKLQQISKKDPERSLRDLAKRGLHRLSEMQAETQAQKPSRVSARKRPARRAATGRKKK